MSARRLWSRCTDPYTTFEDAHGPAEAWYLLLRWLCGAFDGHGNRTATPETDIAACAARVRERAGAVEALWSVWLLSHGQPWAGRLLAGRSLLEEWGLWPI